MNQLSSFVRDPAARKRLLLFALCGGLAVVTGFSAVTPHLAEVLIVNGGYYYMLGLFGLFVFFAVRVARARREVWTGWLRRPGWPALVIAAATAFALWADPFQHKVLFDEYVLQATAFHMHITKEIGTVIRAYDIGGTWLPIDTFLDKRPYFFTFLLSLVHDLAGYRIANVFFLNAGFTAACLSLAYRALRTQGRERSCELPDGRVELRHIDDLTDQTPGERGLRVDQLAGQQQPVRASLPDQPGHECRMDNRRDADLDLGHAELSRAAGDANIACHGQLKAAAKRPTRDARDDGNRRAPHALTQIAQALDEMLRRGTRQCGHFVDVGAGDKGLVTRAAQDQHADFAQTGKLAQRTREVRDDRRAKDVQRLCALNRERRDTVFVKRRQRIG